MRTLNSSVAIVAFLFGSLFILPCEAAAAVPGSAKSKILIVGSYHQEDAWSQDALKGFFAAMKTFGYFDSEEQATVLLNNNFVETLIAGITNKCMFYSSVFPNT